MARLKEGKVGSWAVDMLESERGWGSRVDETIYFETKDEAEAYKKDYNEKYNNKKNVPDWYIVAMSPRLVS